MASGTLSVGDLVIAPGPDADSTPYLCRITSVAVKRFCDVDASDAWLEGVGDRSLDAWIRERAGRLAERAAELGIPFDERTEIVFERFSFVRPARANEGWSLFQERPERPR
jgi:uncharacterized protein YhfF